MAKLAQIMLLALTLTGALVFASSPVKADCEDDLSLPSPTCLPQPG